MQLKKLNSDSRAWKEFLTNNEHLIIHTPEWKEFVRQTFPRTKSKYYAITNKREQIKSIFPIFYTPFSFVSNISSPFLEYGGPAGKISKMDFQKIKKVLPKNIEIRSGVCDNVLSKHLFEIRKSKRFVLKLLSEEQMWNHIHKYKRKAVRLAEKSGVIIKDIPKTKLNELYQLYLKSMHSFGTPPYSRKYFKKFYNFFVQKNRAKVLGAYYNGKLIAFLTGFTVSNRIHININVSDSSYLKYRPNDALHWAFIKWGCNNGFNEFDFGTVFEGRGQFQFKKKWNAELLDLNYYYLKSKKTKDPFYFKFDIFSRIWKLIPIQITSLIGQIFREIISI
jgi:hypothetical protein